MTLGKLLPNKKDLEKRMNELKENINKLKDEIKKINDLLNSFMENINIYYDINNDINNSFNIQLKNYETLNNLKEINDKDILKDIIKIIDEKNLCNKFKYIFDFYTSMNEKDENNYFEDDMNNKQNKIKSKPNQQKNNNHINMGNQNMMNNINQMEMFNPYNQNIVNNNYPIGMMGMPMNMGMPNMMNNNIPMGMGFDEEWLKGFKMGVQEEPSKPKKNIIFKTTQGKITNLEVDLDLTIDELLKKYLKHVGREELIGDKKRRICFLYNATSLKFGDKTTVKAFFYASENPKIIINDVNNLIGF